MRNGPASASLIVLCASLGLAACGAKTGLLVPDVVEDTADVTDVTDVTDITDITDVTDVFDACVPGMFTLTPRTADVMFLIDRSTSMNLNIDGSMTLPSRWTVLQSALAATLPTYQDTLGMGASFFPLESDPADPSIMAACQVDPSRVDVPLATHHAAPILSVFDATMPNGGTPTAHAIANVTNYLSSTAARGHAQYIVLATDGGPNCDFGLDAQTCDCTSTDAMGVPNCANPDPMQQLPFNCLDIDATIAAIDIAFTRLGIPVYVIGIPDSSRTDLIDALSAMAVAGGRPQPAPGPRFYNVQRAADLTTAFSDIQRAIARCAFVTPSRPDDPNDIEIDFAGAPLTRDTSRMNGWDWTDTGFGEITLFGAACDAAIANPGAPLTARVGCRDGG